MITTRPMTMKDAEAYMTAHLSTEKARAHEILVSARDRGTWGCAGWDVDYTTTGKGGNNRGHFVFLIDIEPGDIVSFPVMADPLNGDESLVTVKGKVIRGPWGRTRANVTVRTLEEPSRLFARQIASVELVRKAAS
jgi:hypothetical protein